MLGLRLRLDIHQSMRDHPNKFIHSSKSFIQRMVSFKKTEREPQYPKPLDANFKDNNKDKKFKLTY